MGKVSSGIKGFDSLIDSLYIGDNVIWEVETGTSCELFVKGFIRSAVSDGQNMIYVNFNRSPQSILQQLGELPSEGFILLDCFSSGKGKNDRAFMKFYENNHRSNVIMVKRPGDISSFTDVLNSLEDSFPSGARYVFDSLTGMQDLWGSEQSTYKFFTYMCPRLYDLDTVAYWILEKEAHDQTFKANLRHITQVVFDLYKRKDKLYIKALKLDGRDSREAFKPHLYRTDNKEVSISHARKEPLFDIGTRVREARIKRGLSQKELADRVELTASFISQIENNQISPSLNSFIQLCNALRVSPDQFLEGLQPVGNPWLIRKEKTLSHVSLNENGLRGFNIFTNGSVSGSIFVLEPDTSAKKHFTEHKGKQLIYLISGNISVVVEGEEESLQPGDCILLKDERPSLWKNEGGEKAELLVVCL